MNKPKITIRKYNGDDLYSWAVFIDNHPRPVMCGMDRHSAQYERDRLKKEWAGVEKVV